MRLTLRCLTALLLLLPGCLLAFDSPMFRGDPAHSGVYDTSGVLQSAKVKWKFQTQGRVYSSPAVVKGVVYFGSTDHYLYAVDKDSGTLKWKSKTGSGITSSPAVENGAVYFGSYDGFFYAVDADTGKLKWKFQTAGERRYAGKHLHGSLPAGEAMPDPFDFYLSSPV